MRILGQVEQRGRERRDPRSTRRSACARTACPTSPTRARAAPASFPTGSTRRPPHSGPHRRPAPSSWVAVAAEGRAAESEKLELLNVAKCIRAHGLPSFPDPTASPPPAPPPGSHTGNAIGIGEVYLVFPSHSPALKRAAAACGFRIPDDSVSDGQSLSVWATRSAHLSHTRDAAFVPFSASLRVAVRRAEAIVSSQPAVWTPGRRPVILPHRDGGTVSVSGFGNRSR